MCQLVHSKSESYGHVPANNACKFGPHLKYKRIVGNVAIESLVALVGRLLLCLHRCKGDGITMNLWIFLQHTFSKFHETRLWTCVDVRYYLFLLVSLLQFPSCRPLPCCQQNYGCRIGLSGRVFVWNCGFRFSVWVLVSSLIYFSPNTHWSHLTNMFPMGWRDFFSCCGLLSVKISSNDLPNVQIYVDMFHWSRRWTVSVAATDFWCKRLSIYGHFERFLRLRARSNTVLESLHYKRRFKVGPIFVAIIGQWRISLAKCKITLVNLTANSQL